VGRLCYEALYGRSDVCRDCQVLETLFGGQHTSRHKRHWELEDEPQEWEISSYPIYDHTNQVIQAIVHEQDVTEKRRLEATLAQSEKLAAVGQLAAGLAHEINNPLTAIIANAQMLQRELPPEDDRQELVDLIYRAGGRASKVVHNLLDLARKEQYDFKPTDLNETVNGALKLLQHEFVSRSLTLIWEPAEGLPLIMASQDQLQGVWINLLSNALDALENGHNELRISTRQQGKEVRVVVADNGKGIPPDKLKRIFEPFYTTKAPGRGTGLGLSVSYRVIKQHGGNIQVESKPGGGTQFSVLLPVQ
jgi:two-component system NtrC family sensor kinase